MPDRLGSNGRRGRLDWKLARSGSVVVIGGRQQERASGIRALTVETCSCCRWCVCGLFVMLIPPRATGYAGARSASARFARGDAPRPAVCVSLGKMWSPWMGSREGGQFSARGGTRGMGPVRPFGRR